MATETIIVNTVETTKNDKSDDLICILDDVQIIDNLPSKGFVKIRSSLRDKLIKKLNAQSESLFDKSLEVKDKVSLLKENNQIITTLTNLPIIGRTTRASMAPFTDMDIECIERVNTTTNNSDGVKLKEVESMLAKLPKFNPKTDNIRGWFLKYEMYCRSFKWSEEDCSLGLNFFLDSSLIRVIHLKKATSFDAIKVLLSDLVDDLLSFNGSFHNHLIKMVTSFNDLSLNNQERRYWLDCFATEKQIITYYSNTSSSESSFFRTNLRHLYH